MSIWDVPGTFTDWRRQHLYTTVIADYDFSDNNRAGADVAIVTYFWRSGVF